MMPRLALLLDPQDEKWPSMDLVGEMLFEALRCNFHDRVEAHSVEVRIGRFARRSRRIPPRVAFNVDRMATRFVRYPARALLERRRADLFHVVDHSYAQLVHSLPAERTGVYCHDLDTFASILEPERGARPAWFRAMTAMILAGMKRASVVFHSTLAVRRKIEHYGLVDPRRLVHAPYGVALEFAPRAPRTPELDAALRALDGAPYLLHVGSGIARKRLDVLFETFAHCLAAHPRLWLVQQGATFDAAQIAHARHLGIERRIVQPAKLTRVSLAALYGGAAAVLLTSDAEGFGFPIVEALACGAAVVASDLPVLREVGGDAALYASVGDARAFASRVRQVLERHLDVPDTDARRVRASRFTWRAHASTILEAYEEVFARLRREDRAIT